MFKNIDELIRFIESNFTSKEVNKVLYYLRNEEMEEIIKAPIKSIGTLSGKFDSYMFRKG